MIIQNQVLKDMDTVIQLRDKGVSPEEGKMKNVFSNELISSKETLVVLCFLRV